MCRSEKDALHMEPVCDVGSQGQSGGRMYPVSVTGSHVEYLKQYSTIKLAPMIINMFSYLVCAIKEKVKIIMAVL